MISGAELCLSPMGLSLVSKLAPRSLQGVMMGVWFLATFVGNTLAGVIGMLWPPWSRAHFFLLLVLNSLGSAALLWLQRRRLVVALGAKSGSHGASTDHTQRVV
jgi:POT family proton-dependent oligopeptide transporter